MCSVSLSLFCFVNISSELLIKVIVVGFCQIRNTQKLNVSTFKRNLEEQVYHFTSSFIIFPTGLIRVKPGTHQADFQELAVRKTDGVVALHQKKKLCSNIPHRLQLQTEHVRPAPAWEELANYFSRYQ